MNILVISRDLPYPLIDGSKLRTFNLLTHLSKNNNISIICYASVLNKENDVLEMKKYFDTVRIVRIPRKPRIKQLPGITKDFFSAVPWMVKNARSREMEDTINELKRTKSFDLIHIDNLYFAIYHKFFPKPFLKTITFHDIEGVRYKRMFKVEKNPYLKALYIMNWFFVRNWEIKMAKKFDLCITMSSIDRKILKTKNKKLDVAVIPNGVDTDLLRLLPYNQKQENISFFGSMGYPPNYNAALYFYRQIFPIVKLKMPNCKFLLVGRTFGDELKKLSDDSNVTVTGFVESVIPYYKKTSVIVVPLRAGGGTRLKILEAMALGRPVVSTSIGCEGLDVTHGENIMIADRPEDFAMYTVELMKNTNLRKKLIERGRKFVESYHNWRSIAKKLDKKYQKLFEQRWIKN